MKRHDDNLVLPPPAQPAAPALDVQGIRADFPALKLKVHGNKPLVYLDNAATTQKPQAVIDRLSRYYTAENANIHRGVYALSQHATAEYEAARRKVQRFLNAAHPHEIIFTRGATEGINLVAQSHARPLLKPGDEILISCMEHHSNIVPWQMVCQQTGAVLKVIPINDAGELLFDEYLKLLSDRTRLVSVVHASNVLGTINPVKRIIDAAHAKNAVVLVDGAQWAGHGPTDVQDLDADFYVISGHKLYGPTGIGVLYGKSRLLNAMPPYQGGGDMISSVTFEKTTYNDPPYKFEAGTPHIAGAIGLGAAIDYLTEIGFDRIMPYERMLTRYACDRLSQVPGLHLIGHAQDRIGALTFVMETPSIAPMDIGAALDREGIAVRTGHHCCQPLMQRMHLESTTRISLSFYNTREEIDQAVHALRKLHATCAQNQGTCPAACHATNSQIHWPSPAASSCEQAAEKLIEIFDLLGDWEQRDQFVLELGQKLPPMPPEFKTERTRVHGCMSTVHLVGRKHPNTPDTLDFLADSDAHLVCGLIALLQQVYSGQPARQILAFDFEGFIQRLGLDKHLSMGRRSGLAGMIQRIRALANHLLKRQELCIEQQL